jgi:Zn-dependent protease with chaperone function
MADDAPLYPPPPTGMPPHWRRPGLRYRLRLIGLLAALVLFLAFYLALVVAALLVLLAALLPPTLLLPRVPDSMAAQIGLAVLRLGVGLAAGMFCAYLVKGFLTRRPDDTSNWVPVTAAEQPELFDFITRLCAEIGCPPPARVFLNHEANAAVSAPTSIASLFVAPGKDLLIGLGLFNFLDLVEFKALLAHEFGHLTQRELALSLHVQRLYLVVQNMVHGRDRWDDWMVRASDMPVVSAFLVPLQMLVDGTRAMFKWLFALLHLAHRGLAWQMEYHADLVGVGAAGSEAVARLERKSGVAQAALNVCTQELVLASEQGLFTRDLFYHQQLASAGVTGDTSAPASAFHPSSAERLEQAQALAVASPVDDRPAWLLLRDRSAVCSEVTRQFYWVCLNADPETLAEPEEVQSLIDQERGAQKIDPRYRGVYDGRFLELADLESWIAASPPPHAELANQLDTLYSDDLVERAADQPKKAAEFNLLACHCPGGVNADKPFTFRGREHAPGAAAALLEQVRAELQETQAQFASFDRQVFMLHAGLADELGRGEEYRERYRFHAGLQQVAGRLSAARDRLDGVLRYLSSGKPLFVDQLGGLLVELSEAVDLVDAAYGHAEQFIPPPLAHVKPGRPLHELLPPRPATKTLATTDALMGGTQLVTFRRELNVVLDRADRLWVKSLNGILALQAELTQSAEKATA